MAGEIIVESPVRIKNVTLRKTGAASFLVRIPPFWVEGRGLQAGDELEAYMDNNRTLILRAPKVGVEA